MPQDFILFGLLGVLIIFMIYNTRKRNKKMKAQQEEKATKTLPGVKVLLQGGIYGKIVAYDNEDLDTPALIEIAPGTIIEVHSQAILRIVEPVESLEDGAEREHEVTVDNFDEIVGIETPEETRARLDRDSDKN